MRFFDGLDPGNGPVAELHSGRETLIRALAANRCFSLPRNTHDGRNAKKANIDNKERRLNPLRR